MYSQDLKLVSNTKVLPGEDCGLQHKLLICGLSLRFKKYFLKEIEGNSTKQDHTLTVDETWQQFKSRLLNAGEKVCGFTKIGTWDVVLSTWWWDELLNSAVEG